MTTHHFQPNYYFNTLGQHEPVLHVDPGDTIVTTTVDADGYDSSGAQVAHGGNPQTGPFYLEGAAPGDTLVLHIDRITPNRATGWSSTALAPNVVDPHFVPHLIRQPVAETEELALWDLDQAAGTATLRTPETRLGRLRLPLAPMLGCFGVAAWGGQSISTGTSAQHGGNMDYRGFCAGTTVYLPVFTPGALFFLGDGHAVQGDGEVAGTGVEVSMEVEFRLDLLKNKTIHWPRGENSDFIFTVGNTRPLDQALQHATSEMVRWLQEEYALDALSAALLIGQAVNYEVGNVFDPAYTMVCKMAKTRLIGFVPSAR